VWARSCGPPSPEPQPGCVPTLPPNPWLRLPPPCRQVWDVIRYSDVPAPPGCELKVKDPSQPVVRCAAKVGGE
jgi:hypothetical protein